MDVSNNMRDKVMLALTVCQGYRLCDPDHCPYADKVDGHECLDSLHEDALALLKAQEPMKPIRDINGVYYCGNCDTICVGYEVEFTHSIIKVENYCHNCGRAVKWE